VIIVGGGSTLCLGKAVGLMLSNPGKICDYEGNDKTKNPPVPVIAIPTTAGSGSEVSRGLVLHEAGRDREIVVRGNANQPRVALLDGTVLKDCPYKPLLDAALDAITHACEALWAKNRSIMTDGLAEKALTTFITYLPAALKERDLKALQKLIEASTAANIACGNTALGLVHALSSAPAVKLPHGYQNGALLLAVIEFNRPILEPGHQKMVDQIKPMFEKIGWQCGFAPGEIDEEKAKLMVTASAENSFRFNNARPSSDEDCFKILKAAGADISVGA